MYNVLVGAKEHREGWWFFLVMSIRGQEVILFPSSTQFFIACNTEKRGDPGIFPHVNMV